MKIYIASSWKNQHAVEMLTDRLRDLGHTVLSFVENNHGENPNSAANEAAYEKPVPFDEWCASPDGERSFIYDTDGAMLSDLVIYVGPSGKDAAAECGMAFARGVPVVGLHAKGEDFGLMRRMMRAWFFDYRTMLMWIKPFFRRERRRHKRPFSPATGGAGNFDMKHAAKLKTESNGKTRAKSRVLAQNFSPLRGESFSNSRSQ